MAILIIALLALVHILLCIIAYTMCVKAKENEWGLFWVLCFIPYIGPLFVVWSYATMRAYEDESK